MKCIWPAAAFVTLVFGYGVTPWDTIRSIAAARGVDDDTQTLMWQAAGYLLPAIVATIITFMIMRYSKFIGPWYVALPSYVASAYINSWGMPLFITGLALGTAAAMHVDNWYQKFGGF